MKNTIQWIVERLKERSTWLGIVSLMAVVGVHIEPNQSELLISAGVAVAGFIAVFSSDSKPKQPHKS